MNWLTLLILSVFSFSANSQAFHTQSDVPYGPDSRQVFDVYTPNNAKNAPVIFMVHGGAWRIGDKASKTVVKNKVNFWLSKGFVLISTNYRLLPTVKPVEQAHDVARALSYAQKNIKQWGGRSDQFVLMGHSAGAHLVSMISTDTRISHEFNTQPWLGTVAIDSAAYNVVELMSVKRPKRLYKKAFGTNKKYWQQASPFYLLSSSIPPFLAICSLKRGDESCGPANAFVTKVKSLGSIANLKRYNLSHRELNKNLGDLNAANRYTRDVEQFIDRLLIP